MLTGRVDWEGHYDPWKHATESLLGRASEQDRASAIFQLRRALEFRDKALKALYRLDKIPGFPKNAYPKVLSDLNIVLPIMRRKLIDLRNEVAHDHGKPPPELIRCQEYAEFTWYFLKSTDHLLSSPIGTLEFNDNPDSYTITVNLEDWSMLLNGVLNVDLILEAGNFDLIEVEVFQAELIKDRVYFKGDPYKFKGSRCKMNPSLMLNFLKTYFSTRY